MKTKRHHISKGGEVELEFILSEALEAYDDLAREVLAQSRISLSLAARYLNAALWHLPATRQPLSRTLSLGADALRYDPENVVDRFRADPAEMVRDCLHAALHGVFRHPLERGPDEFDTWSLACDIAVEACAMELAGTRFPSADDTDRAAAVARLAKLARSCTAPALYRVLRHGGPGERLYASYGLTGADVERFRDLFARDAHELWACRPHVEGSSPVRPDAAAVPDLQAASGESAQAAAGSAGGGAEDAGTPPDGADAAPEDQAAVPDVAPEGESEPPGAPDALEGESAGADAFDAPDSPAGPDAPEGESAEPDASDFQAMDEGAARQLDGEWRQVGKQVEAAWRAQRAGSSGGNGDGTMLANLSVASRKAVDYGDFLRRFATVGEDMRVSPDEFDYVYYTYGLSRYGNVPLVEPLEYTEAERVREFVIAIDTSGSCSGRLVRSFVERTYDILRQQAHFGDKLNVHIVQCDKQVRAATKVESLAQLEGYAESFWVSGGGGTDFRPVFSYVDSLVERGEFDDLRGLVYFTDGYGTFPTRPPDYDVAFVFVDVEGLDVRVPPWACKAVMTQDELMEG